MEGHFDKEAALAAIKRTRMLGEASMTGLYALNPYLYKNNEGRCDMDLHGSLAYHGGI